jgi:hypothetical protein
MQGRFLFLNNLSSKSNHSMRVHMTFLSRLEIHYVDFFAKCMIC